MRLATSTCIFPAHRQGGRTPLEESIKMCHECGFRVIDLNWGGAGGLGAKSELAGDDWERNIDSIGNLAAKLGVEFSQSHMPFDSNLYRPEQKLSDEYRVWFAEASRRCIIASGKLGVRWVVTHAQTATEQDEMCFEENMRANIHYYTPLLELAKKEGTGIAIENMAEFHPAKTKHRFTAALEEQIAIIDAMGDPISCRACWDFGHAELVYRDQVKPLRKLGHRLAAPTFRNATDARTITTSPSSAATQIGKKLCPFSKRSATTATSPTRSTDSTPRSPMTCESKQESWVIRLECI